MIDEKITTTDTPGGIDGNDSVEVEKTEVKENAVVIGKLDDVDEQINNAMEKISEKLGVVLDMENTATRNSVVIAIYLIYEMLERDKELFQNFKNYSHAIESAIVKNLEEFEAQIQVGCEVINKSLEAGVNATGDIFAQIGSDIVERTTPPRVSPGPIVVGAVVLQTVMFGFALYQWVLK